VSGAPDTIILSEMDPETAFQLGLEAGRKEELYRFIFKGVPAFEPWTQAVQFESKPALIDALVAYERRLLQQLRQIQRERCIEQLENAHLKQDVEAAYDFARRAPEELRGIAWPHRWKLRLLKPWVNTVFEAKRDFNRREEAATQMARVQRVIEAELATAQQAVDAELDTGRGHKCTVEAMRAAPVRPAAVREYPDIRAFLDEDPRRALISGPGLPDAGGEDRGWEWHLENPLRRWETTRWRLSWLCMETGGYIPTHEIYAVEIIQTDPPAMARVWLMGIVRDRHRVIDILSELEQYAQRERNSLVLVASRISEVIKRIQVSEDPSF
jgi:hypothetical protein